MDPILINIGPFSLSSLWVFATFGFIAGIKVFLVMVQKRKLKLNILFEHGLWLILIPILFSRIFGVIVNSWRYEGFSGNTLLELFYFWDQNFSLWAALFSYSGLMVYFLKKDKQSYVTWFDAMSLPTLVTLAFVNIGKYLDGAGYGTPSNLPWAVSFENITVKYTVPIHPTQLYQFIYVVGIIIATIYISKNNRFFDKEGNLALFSVFSYSCFRFIEEFIRGDGVTMLGPIRLPQIAALISLSVCLLIYFKKTNRKFPL